MAVSDAARHDLYNGLTELLGPERTETLMAYLPHYDAADVARRADIDRLELELREVRGGLTAVNARLDKLFLSLLAGMFVLLAAIGGLAAAVL